MTWAEVGQIAAMAGVALAGWFGFWTMADRRFAELRGAIDRTNGAINDVKVTVTGVQKDVQYLRRDLDRLTSRRDGDDSEGQRP